MIEKRRTAIALPTDAFIKAGDYLHFENHPGDAVDVNVNYVDVDQLHFVVGTTVEKAKAHYAKRAAREAETRFSVSVGKLLKVTRMIETEISVAPKEEVTLQNCGNELTIRRSIACGKDVVIEQTSGFHKSSIYIDGIELAAAIAAMKEVTT